MRKTINISIPAYAASLLAVFAVACHLNSSADGGSGVYHTKVIQVRGAADVTQSRQTDSFGGNTSPSASPQAVTANGSPIGDRGTFLCFNSTTGAYTPCSETEASHLVVYSQSNSTMAILSLEDGKFSPEFPLFYTSTDCSLGQGETPFAGGAWVGTMSLREGQTFRDQVGNDSDATSYWYLASGATLQTKDIESQRVWPDGHCETLSQPGLRVYPTTANTTALSGYGNAALGALGID